jgi:hypothetical protein
MRVVERFLAILKLQITIGYSHGIECDPNRGRCLYRGNPARHSVASIRRHRGRPAVPRGCLRIQARPTYSRFQRSAVPRRGAHWRLRNLDPPRRPRTRPSLSPVPASATRRSRGLRRRCGRPLSPCENRWSHYRFSTYRPAVRPTRVFDPRPGGKPLVLRDPATLEALDRVLRAARRE